MMGPEYGYGPMHWGIGLLGFLVFASPGAMILGKAGYSRWWILVSLIPILNLIMYWVFAFSRWPIEDRVASR